ncbi:MAG: hypothetical protein HKN18_03665, partial [Silicimonas sp.]|nr:hypothetical protein [Silicimonas sp.]
LVAGQAGVVSVSADVIVGVNAIHESITLATLPDMMRVDEGQLVATIKIIPYGVDGACLKAVLDLLDESPIRLHPFKTMRVQLVLTHTPGFKDSLLTKGSDVVSTRIEALGASLQTTSTVLHNKDDISAALDPAMDLILILGASATSDRSDVIPAAIVEAGGRIDRFGMPVDPGNLLVLGDLGGTPVVGLPGCARSPAMNGVDWVLERIAAGLPIDGNAIAQMGVGGLLKEMPGRPQPREP